MTEELIVEQSGERSCGNHPDFPAIAICSLCGQDMCAHCHTVSVTGYAVCRGCPVAEAAMPKTTWESRSGFERLHGFADTAAAILINPRSFFGVIGPTREWFLPTLFGYICVMIGTAAALAWQILLVPEFTEVLDEIVTQLGVSRDTAVSLLFFSLPLSAAVIHSLHLGLLYMSLMISGAKNVSGTAVARIAGYASAAQLFLIIPPILSFPVGHFFAIMWLFNLEVTGVRTYFGLTFGRAILVVLTPFLFMALFGT